MKLIIAGGRDFNDYDLLERKIFHLLSQVTEPVEIVSGEAKGADKLGEKYALNYGYKLTKFPADWDKHGKSAGYKRNKQMAEYASHAVIFWDGESKGSKHMIDLAKSSKLEMRVIYYDR